MSEEVREDYLESLEELTVNSRPIIKTLTEIAQENVADATAVVDAIETHALRCPPTHKLPALYLVDSICKNIGSPYTSLFNPRIVNIFSDAFTVSPEPVKIKLNELFKTWAIPVPATGQPLFPHETLRHINEFLVRQQAASMPQFPQGGPYDSPMVAPPPSARPRLNQSALMVEMNRFRQVLENEVQDQFNERQLSLLSRLEAQISGVVDPKLLPEIQNSLEEMKISHEQQAARNANAGFRRGGSGGGGSSGNSRQQGGGRRDTRRNGGGHRDNNNSNNNNNGHGSRDHHKDRRSVSGGGGVSKITGTNNIPLGTRKSKSPKLGETEINAISEAALAKVSKRGTDLESALENLDLATACDTAASQFLINQLYAEGLPLQCSTCGYRFHDTEEGREAKRAEMDWHFRANKDIREGHSRNRSWFLAVVSWVAYRDEDEVFGSGSALAASANVGGAAAAGANGMGGSGDDAGPVDLEAEKQKYTEVPLDSNVVCPVCQEPHETSWSEEAEDWVWMNCVEVGGYYFHATCYADPQNKQLVASLLETKA